MEPVRSPLHQACPAIIAGVLLALGFLVYGATGHDDAHITFWSAGYLAEHGRIANYNGEAVQQSSTLLLTLLLAGVHAITGISLPAAGYLASMAAALACCLLLARAARQPLLAVLLLLSSASFLLWSYSGMESTLAACCLLSMLLCWARWLDATRPSALPFALLAVCTAALLAVRPEMPLLACALACWSVFMHWQDRQRRRRSLQLLVLSVGMTAGLLAGQYAVFGSCWPLPVSAKSGGLLAQWRPGVVYLLFGSALNPLLPLSLLVACVLLWRRGTAGQAVETLGLGVLLAYGAFIVLAGGDWMQAGRFLVPLLPVASLLCTALLVRWPRAWLRYVFAVLLCAVQAGLQYGVVARVAHGIPVWAQYRLAPAHDGYSAFEKLNQEHLRDMAVIDHLAEIIPPLRDQLGRPPVLMSGQAGMVFYYTARRFGQDVQFRDLRGLVESSLTDCAATRDVERSQQGLFWGYREFFQRLPALAACGIVAPDIIYDLNDMSQKMGKTLEPLGYTMIHQETGLPVENPTRWPANRLLSPNMIFVRNDLLPLLGNPPRQVVDYGRLPLVQRWPLASH